MISAIVLAAGRSRRMGTQKLLLPFSGQPLIAKVVDELLRSPVDQVVVVIGEEGNPVKEALVGHNVLFVTSAHPGGEMLDSVRSGLGALPEETVGALVVLGDQPAITADVVANLVQAFRACGRGIVVPTHQGTRGHPLLFRMQYRDEIRTHYDDCGLRGLLEAHPEDVAEVEFASPGVLEDVDFPEDYHRATGRDSDVDLPS